MNPAWIALGLLGCSDKTTPHSPHEYESHDTAIDSDSGELDTGLESFEVIGQVVDSDGVAVGDAMVLVGGEDHTMVSTNGDGEFSLW